MAPVKVEEDAVIAEYDVFVNRPVDEQVYLVQYTNRRRERPYDAAHHAAPCEMRIKPNAGYLEAGLKTVPDRNYNKYMGLKWGDSAQIAKEVHNPTGTYGLAAGLITGKPRASARDQLQKDATARDRDYGISLQDFAAVEREGKIFNQHTLGGLIERQGEAGHSAKTALFVGAFYEDKLHMTKVNAIAQLTPQFHHVDAESERIRLAHSRALQDGVPAAGMPRNLRQTYTTKAERDTAENRLKKMLTSAERERWVPMTYFNEAASDSFTAFNSRFFVEDAEAAKPLKSSMEGEQYLDTIITPRHHSPTRRRKRAAKRKDDGGGSEEAGLDDESAEGAAAG